MEINEKRPGAARRLAGWLAALALLVAASGAAAAEKVIVDFNDAKTMERVQQKGVSAAIGSNGVTNVLEVTCAPSDEGYPGVTIVAPEGGWDLSQCGRVETTVTNVGEAPLYLTLRVDNAGDWRKNPWNASSVSIAPGKSATLRTTFGYSWDKPGYKLDSSKVSQVLLFTGKAGKPLKYRIENLRGAGAAGEKPRGLTEKVRPADGTLWSASEKIDPERLHGMNGGVAKAEAAGIAIDLPAPTGNRRAAVAIDPKAGELWDLSLCSEATFSVKNVGDAPLKLLCRLDNNNPRDDAINCAVARAEIPAGATREVTVAFVTDKVFDFNKKDSGFVFGSDAVHRATLVNDGPAGGKALLTAIKGKKRAARPPEWLGKRPPVPGNWKMTFEDNFDGKEIDRAKWVFPADDLSVPDPDGNCNRSIISIWDKLSLNTANNVLAGDGHMTLRVTKMQDPQAEAKKLAEKLFGDKIGERAEEVKKMQQRRYLSTVITTFDRFAQKYGYFEARMKLADGLGMWPAFWLMPDRGKEAGIWWKRNATDHGGMEFDILEQLGRYGPCRYNVAMHWDGYGKDHKAVGTENVYFLPDPDGYVTSGLLWEPGRARFYVQGRLVADWQNERVATVPMFIMFTQPLGGWGTNGVVEDAKLPFDFKVDYVRVWQRDDLAGK